MLAAKIKSKAFQLGYTACGIIPTSAVTNYTGLLDKRIASFPESKALYEPLCNLAQLPESAKTIIVCIRRYNNYKIPNSLSKSFGKALLVDVDGNGKIPYSPEYRAKIEFEAYLKILGINKMSNAVPERLAAAKAGLGKFGRNNFIYSPDCGSYICIYTWVTDKELDYDTVEENIHLSVCNDNCNKCIKACSTNALSGCMSMDRGKCIAQLSFHATDTLDEETRPQMGQWLYGCDDCQDSCPLNKNRFTESDDYPLLKELEEYLQPEKILEMDEDTYINIIYPRFWYTGKDGMWLWKCNALRSMINSGEKKYQGLIKKYRDHEDLRIREVSQWGCTRLGI